MIRHLGLLALAVPPALLGHGLLGHELPAPPAPVVMWFADEGPGVVMGSENSGLPAEELVAIEVGRPIGVATWSEEFLAGGSITVPVVPSGEWIAPITMNGGGLGALVGAEGEAGAITDHRVIWDEDLGDALASQPSVTFILDEQTSGWFRLGVDILAPVTAEARDVLAGSIELAAYQPFLVDRYSADDSQQSTPADRGPDRLMPVLITAASVAGVLAVVGVVVWIRRPEAP